MRKYPVLPKFARCDLYNAPSTNDCAINSNNYQDISIKDAYSANSGRTLCPPDQVARGIDR